MGLQRCYNLRCDGCGKIHPTTCPNPRRARAVAKHDGWARRTVKVGEYQARIGKWMMVREHLYSEPVKRYVLTDEWETRDDYAGRDFCPTCLDAMGQILPAEAGELAPGSDV